MAGSDQPLGWGDRPSPGDAVRIVVDGQSFAAYADSLATDSIDLLAARGALPHELTQPGATDATVEYLVNHDVWRLLGSLGFSRQDEAGTVWRFDHRRVPQLLLRREYVRAPISAGLRLWTPVGRHETRTLSISGDGMTVPAAIVEDVGQEDVAFMLSVPGHSPIRGSARIVRSGDNSGELAFTEISDADRTVLTLAVYDEQRRLKDDAQRSPGLAAKPTVDLQEAQDRYAKAEGPSRNRVDIQVS
ncbi:PilZ domain-containing protein [Baekduia soli]|uniref:PilZ domain-containing protein n=1 Tax=Baekduia soli TaxID=496014 RepID=A0A5B8U6E8_9ACTN|nr:PilZ domain-containing protein [Baekduia soli]QEC48567.1 PilZ domain-containing protein [Baekduia soli]